MISTRNRFATPIAAGLLGLLVVLAGEASGAHPDTLQNGGMESREADGSLAGWLVPSTLREAGYAIGPESGDVFQGEGAARLDSRTATVGRDTFGNLMQVVDAAPYRGKRVRYRAAVRVAEAEAGGTAQLWLRVDLPSPDGAWRTDFFDNMGDRPILSAEWKTYEIVGDVSPDAEKIALGVMTLGRCLAFVDEATLEVTSDALRGAATQPFFTWWLALPLSGLALFAIGLLAPGRLGKFALEFTFVYWVLYALPALVAGLVPVLGGAVSHAYEAGPVDAIVRWVAARVIGIEAQLVSALGNGSGDTTFSYVQALVTFVLALAVAALWSLVDRRATGHARLKMLLRDALRYYLAITMLAYGLSKLSTLYNQFPPPGLSRLEATYGASSPMGLLWTFMGSSRAYTAFGGAMETLGGILLLWRRTTLLGALTTMAVMTNVMVLNFCYDVPVKLFSFHLVVAAACLALPDAPRLAHVLLGIGSAATSMSATPRAGRRARWGRRVLEAYLLLIVLVAPILDHWYRERSVAAALPALGEWKLSKLEEGGRPIEPSSDEVVWLTLSPHPTPEAKGWTTDYVAKRAGDSSTSGNATLTAVTLHLAGKGGGPSRLIPGEFSWRVADDELHLETPTLHATFAPATRDFLLVRRGFRWINERPFNR